MKTKILLILSSLFLSFLIIITIGNYNSLISQDCDSNNDYVSVVASEMFNYSRNDINKLKEMIINNNLIFQSTVTNFKIGDKNNLYYKDPQSKYLSCINYFKNYQNDIINQYIFNFRYEKKDISFNDLQMFSLYKDNINYEQIKNQFVKYGLVNKFNIIEKEQYTDNYYDNTYFMYFISSCMLITLSFILYDFYHINKKSKELNILNSFGYNNLLVLRKLVLNNRIKQISIILIISLLILLLYYRAINYSFLIIIALLVFLLLIIILFEMAILKIVYLFKKRNIRKVIIIFLSLLFIIINVIVINHVSNVYNLNKMSNLYTSSNLKDDYYTFEVPLNSNEQQLIKVNKELISNNNAFSLNTDNSNGYLVVETTKNYLNNFFILNKSNKRVFIKDDHNYYLTSNNKYLKNYQTISIASNKDILILDNGLARTDSGDIDIKINKEDYLDTYYFRTTGFKNAKEVIEEYYHQVGYKGNVNVISINNMVESSQYYLNYITMENILFSFINLLCLVIFNFTLLFSIIYHYQRQICIKYHFGYSIFKVFKELIIITSIIYLMIALFIIINFSLFKLVILISLIIINILIFYVMFYRLINKYLIIEMRSK
ncbi:MAG: hypothetical protein LBR40_02695 [Bacilli bacterium]|jgi:hypothetical protein|nr:hypothetical protein [Bacilli bacterium]